MTRTVITLITALLTVCSAKAQTVNYHPFEHYTARTEAFAKMRAVDSTDIVMLGNSLTEFGGDWSEKLGVCSHRLNQILPGRPKAIFLMAGINDISHDLTARQVGDLCNALIDRIRRESPTTKLYVQSLLPINESTERWKTLEGKTDLVPVVNTIIRRHCERHGITFINLFPKFTRHGTNEMRLSLTSDGLHLTPQGYKVWAFMLRRYLKGI